MIDREVDIPTAHGSMNTFVTHPEEGGPHPVVLFYMDAPGRREELHDMARRLGTAGYFVVLPNLFYRATREFSIFSEDPAHTREAMFAMMASLTDELVLRDTTALLDFVDTEPAADAGSVGCMGYCMGGPFSIAAACAHPDRIRAAASIHGIRLFGPGSPSGRLDRAAAELYYACAEFDDWVPAASVDDLEAHLVAVGADARVERYPGTHHGFTFPGRDGAYDKDAAERHWERLHALFARNLA